MPVDVRLFLNLKKSNVSEISLRYFKGSIDSI